MTKVKICGIANSGDALQATVAGADYLGLIVEVSFSEDSITRDEAATIIRKLPLEAKSVMVTYLLKAPDIIRLTDAVQPAIIQLHNEITVEEIRKIQDARPNIELTKTISVTGPEALSKAKEFEQHVNNLLLDTKIGERKGGTGQTHDWSISAEITKQVSIPVFLAGGLHPGNVAEAIKTVKPYGVDVNSGVKATAKRKDHRKVKEFIQGVKQ